MNPDDSDWIGDLIRAANPDAKRRDDPLSERAEAELAQLLQRYRQGLRRRVGIVLAALLVLAALGSAIDVWLPSSPASAKTPDPLHFAPTSLTVTEVVDSAVKKLTAQPDRADTAVGKIVTHSWALSTNIGAHDRITSSATIPSLHTLTFRDDGSAGLRIVAAAPFPGETTKGLPKKGTLLGSEEFKPGKYDGPYLGDVPTEPRQVSAWLATSYGTPNSTTGEYIQAITGLMESRLVTNSQESAVLRFIATLPHLSVAGRVTDRLGRPGIAIKTTDRRPGKYVDYLIISTTTGRITAAETIYTGHHRTDIASPSVISYAAWTQSRR